MLKRFGFSDPGKGFPHYCLNKVKDTQQHFTVVRRPVAKIVEKL
jgi:hypothetical protein